MSGKNITDLDIAIGPELAGATVWGKDIYVSDKFLMARFTAKNNTTNEDLYLTGICIKNKDGYTVSAVDGLWYYLEGEGREGTLVGFENDRKEVIGYSVVLKK
jgi:hypothetical protein